MSVARTNNNENRSPKVCLAQTGICPKGRRLLTEANMTGLGRETFAQELMRV